MNNKRLTIIALAIVVAMAGYVVLRSNTQEAECEQINMDGSCLPAGKCLTPNDAVVDCEKSTQPD